MSNVLPIATGVGVGRQLGAAAAEFVATSDFAATTRRVYRRTLDALVTDLEAGSDVDQVTRAQLERHLRHRYGHTAPATFTRHLATLKSFFAWCHHQDLLDGSPAAKLRRRRPRKSRAAERRQRVVGLDELQAYWSNPAIPLRERVLVAMAYDTAARASELLGLNVEDLDLANKQAVVIGKGGDAERIFWTSVTARLLPRLIAGRTRGPLFLADLAPAPARQPAASDRCPDTGRARLSYRRAAELFKHHSQGRTLHQIRHSKLTHLAEAGEDITLIKAKSRHSSLRTLERYVNPSHQAVADLTNRHDPNRRRRR